MTTDRLTALDASFVWLEHPGGPVHVGAVAIFEAAPLLDGDGDLRLDEIREPIAARLDALPAGAAHLLARAVEHQLFVNLVVTNVPGPPVPLYAAGARMLEAFPVVPWAPT